MADDFKQTNVWINAFSSANDPEVDMLVSQYDKAWRRACSLSSQIKHDAQGLTLHDENHFNGLWKAVDLLVSEEFPLNSVETFVLGMAILIHDAAHTVLAFEGGLSAISQTDEWKDNLALALPEDSWGAELPKVSKLQENVRKSVLFNTLRALHAKQAEKLLNLSFKHPAIEEDIYLLEDPTIRRHLGEVIGKIAASHHWNLNEVAMLPLSINAVEPYAKFGSIRPLYLAALMRTADAIQLDHSRAPDFEFALLQPQGLSLTHWNAQNRLATGADLNDSEALLINSTFPFSENESASWWTAFDLAALANRELQQVDTLLRDKSQPRLKLRYIKDVSDAVRFSSHVETKGWEPADAELKVGDTASIVKLLGGSGLYGHDMHVPLRELLQNSVDAVRARRLLEHDYKGQIRVEITEGEDPSGNEGHWLRVADDGIGMTTALMTGPFLTFGKSGWKSDTLRRERSGFLGRGFKHIGQYGIGFFSVFMLGECVRVTSRSFDQGIATAKRIEFTSGLGLRPLIKDASTGTMNEVTSVEVFLDTKTKLQLLAKGRLGSSFSAEGGDNEQQPEQYSLHEVLEQLCPAIDVDIYAFDSDSTESGTISSDWETCEAIKWINRFSTIQKNDIPEVVQKNAHLIEPIFSNQMCIGRASLNPCKKNLGTNAIGGFAKQFSQNSGSSMGFVGALDSLPTGPRREAGKRRDKQALVDWSTSQVSKWANTDLSGDERNLIAASAARFGADSSEVANAMIDHDWLNLEQIIDLLSEGSVFAPIEERHLGAGRWNIRGSVNLESGFLYHPMDIEVETPRVMTAGVSTDFREYWEVPTDCNYSQISFLTMLKKCAAKRQKSISVEGMLKDFGKYVGETHTRSGQIKGERIVIPAVEIKLEPVN